MLFATTLLAGVDLHVRQAHKLLAPAPGQLTAVSMVYDLAYGTVGAFLSAVVIRILLGRHDRAWRLDRALAIYLGLIVAAEMVYRPLGLLSPDKGLLIGDTAGYWGGLATAVAVMLALWRIYVRLMLWPIGALMGEPVTPDRSYRAMKQALWPFVAAILLLTAPAALLGAVVRSGLEHRSPLAALLLGAPIWGFVWVAMAAVGAEVYRRLIGNAAPLALASHRT